ncbi:MAG: PKD domain-containing protein [Mycobacteriales bacterium]
MADIDAVRARRIAARATLAAASALAIAVATGALALPAERSPRAASSRRTPPPGQPLRVNVRARPETAPPGDPVNVIVKVSDGDGQILGIRVDYGDGASDARNRPPQCPSPSSGERSGNSTNRTVHFQHRYAAAGTYTITAVVRTGGCGAADERASARTTATIDPNAPSASPRPSGSRPPSPRPTPRPSRSPSARPSGSPSQRPSPRPSRSPTGSRSPRPSRSPTPTSP